MRRRRTIANTLLDCFLTVLLSFLAVFLVVLVAACRVPPKYLEMTTMSNEDKKTLSSIFLSKALLVLDLRSGNRPFDVAFSDREVNAYLFSGFETFGTFLPREIANPQVHFEQDAIVLMGTVRPRDFIQMVVRVHLAPNIGYDGRMHLDVKEIKGGSLSIPRGVVGDAISRLNDVSLALPNIEIQLKPGIMTILRTEAD